MPALKHTTRTAHALLSEEAARLRAELLAHKAHHAVTVRDLEATVQTHSTRIAALEQALRAARATVVGSSLISPRARQTPAG